MAANTRELGEVALRVVPSLEHAVFIVMKQPDLIATMCARDWSRGPRGRKLDVLQALLDLFRQDNAVRAIAERCAASRDYFLPEKHSAQLVLAVLRELPPTDRQTSGDLLKFALRWLTSTTRTAPRAEAGVSASEADFSIIALVASFDWLDEGEICTASGKWLAQRVLLERDANYGWWFWKSTNRSRAEIISDQLEICQNLAQELSPEQAPTGSSLASIEGTLITAWVGYLERIEDEHILQHGHVAWARTRHGPNSEFAKAASKRICDAVASLIQRHFHERAAKHLADWPEPRETQFTEDLVAASGFSETRAITSFFLAPPGLIENLYELGASKFVKTLANIACDGLSDSMSRICFSDLRVLLREDDHRHLLLRDRATIIGLGREKYGQEIARARDELKRVEYVAALCLYLAERSGDSGARDAVAGALEEQRTLIEAQSMIPDFDRILVLDTTEQRLNQALSHPGWWRPNEAPQDVRSLVEEISRAQDVWRDLRKRGSQLSAGTVLQLFENASDTTCLFQLDLNRSPEKNFLVPSPATVSALQAPFHVERASRLLPALLCLPRRVGADETVFDRDSPLARAKIADHAERLGNSEVWHNDTCQNLQRLLTGDVHDVLSPLGGERGEDVLLWLATEGSAEVLLNFLREHRKQEAFDTLKGLVDSDDADDAIESMSLAWDMTRSLIDRKPFQGMRSLLGAVANMVLNHGNALGYLREAADFVEPVKDIMRRLSEETGASALAELHQVLTGRDPLVVTASGNFSVGNKESDDLRDLRNRIVLSGRRDKLGEEMSESSEEAVNFAQLITDIEGLSHALVALHRSGHPDFPLDHLIKFQKPLQVEKVRTGAILHREILATFQKELDKATRRHFHLNLLPLEYVRGLVRLQRDWLQSNHQLDPTIRTALLVFIRLQRPVEDTDFDSACKAAPSGPNSMENLGLLLKALAEAVGCTQRRRLDNIERPAVDLIRGLDAGKPLLLTTNVPNEIPMLVISLFGQESRAPDADEVLMCRSTTAFNEVRQIIMRAMLYPRDDRAMFVVAGIHNLGDDVQEDTVRWLRRIKLVENDRGAAKNGTAAGDKDLPSLSRRLIFICEERLSTTGMLPGFLRAFSLKSESLDRESLPRILRAMLAVKGKVRVLKSAPLSYGKTHLVLQESNHPVVLSVTRNLSTTRLIHGLNHALGVASPHDFCLQKHVLRPFCSTRGGRCDRCRKDVSKGETVMDCRSCNFYLCESCSPSSDLAPIHIKLAAGIDLERFETMMFELLVIGVLVAPNSVFESVHRFRQRNIFLELPSREVQRTPQNRLLALLPSELIRNPINLRQDPDWRFVAGILSLGPDGVSALDDNILVAGVIENHAPNDDLALLQIVDAQIQAGANAPFLQKVVWIRYVACALRAFFSAIHLSGIFEPPDGPVVKRRRGDVVRMAIDAGRELIQRASSSSQEHTGRVQFRSDQLWSSGTPFVAMVTENGIIPIMRRNGECPSSVTRLLQSDALSQTVKPINFMEHQKEDDMLSSLLHALGKVSDLHSDAGVRLRSRIDKLRFSLTRENSLKAVAIYARIHAGIPVVICGATGIGKTALVRYLAAVLEVKFHTLTIHGGTTEAKLGEWLSHVISDAERDQGKESWVFLDECNAAPITAAIKDVICDKRLPDGRALPGHVRVLAALNPYSDRSAQRNAMESGRSEKKLAATDSHHVHFSSARMYQARSKVTSSVFEILGDDEEQDELDLALERTMDEGDMANLVYRVAPIPQSLGELVWDFGDLSKDDEHVFVQRMVQELGREHQRFVEPLRDGILESHAFIREHCADEPALIVSLRDVQRCVAVIKWLMDSLLPKLQKDYPRLVHSAHEFQPVFHTLMIAYVSRLDFTRRNLLTDRIARRLHVPVEVLHNCVTTDRELFARSMLEGTRGIAQNSALQENLFVLTACIMARVPVFLVGRPGSSKTLAMRIIEDRLRALRTERPYDLPAIEVTSYQCSPLSTGQSILGAAGRVAKAVQRQQERQRGVHRTRHILLLDEVGLAEESPFMPLKVLHELLERNDEFSIVGISNWALDPAKMNRALFLNRGTPSEQDLCDTAQSLSDSIGSNSPDSNLALRELSIEWRRALARGFEIACKGLPVNFFGLRDYYSLVKIFSSCRSIGTVINDVAGLEYAVCRAFGGLPHRLHAALKAFAEQAPLSNVELRARDPLTLIRDNLNSPEARHLLIVSPDEDSALDLLDESEMLRSRDGKLFEPFIGSEFAGDISATAIAVDIGRIKHCVEAGVPVVLLRGDALFEALYDLLNQHYVRRGEKVYAQLALGAERRMCAVHPSFKCVVLMAERIVAEGKVPPPLLNRFEKVYLAQSDVLNDQAKRVLTLVYERLGEIIRFSNATETVSVESDQFAQACSHLFVGFSADNVESLIRKHVRNGMEFEGEDQCQDAPLVDAVLRDMLLTALPEAVLSLPRSEETDWVREVYFSEQEAAHKNLPEALSELKKRNANRHVIFTMSAPVVVHELVPDDHVLDLEAFPTEALFRAAVSRNLNHERGLVLVQCRFQQQFGDDGRHALIRAARLLSQVQHVLDVEVAKVSGDPRIVIIIHLLAGAQRLESFCCRHGSRWSASTVADLEAGVEGVDPLYGLPQLQNVTGRSRSSLVDSSGLCELLFGGELRLSVNRIRYPRVDGVSAERRLQALVSTLKRPITRGLFLAAVQRAMSLNEGSSGNDEAWLREALTLESIESVGSARRSVGLAVLKLLRDSTRDVLLLLDQHLNLLSLEGGEEELDSVFTDISTILFGAIAMETDDLSASSDAEGGDLSSSASEGGDSFARFPWPRSVASITCGHGFPFVPKFPFSALLCDVLLNIGLSGADPRTSQISTNDDQDRLRRYANRASLSSGSLQRFAGDLGMLVGLPRVAAAVPAAQAIAREAQTLHEVANSVEKHRSFLYNILSLCQALPEVEPDVVHAFEQEKTFWRDNISTLVESQLRALAENAHTALGSQTLGAVNRLYGEITSFLDIRLRRVWIGVQVFRNYIAYVTWEAGDQHRHGRRDDALKVLLDQDYATLGGALVPIRKLCLQEGTHSRRFLAASLVTLSECGVIARDGEDAIASATRLFAFAIDQELRASPVGQSAFALAVNAITLAAQGKIDDVLDALNEPKSANDPISSSEATLTLRAIYLSELHFEIDHWERELESWEVEDLSLGSAWNSLASYAKICAAVDGVIDQADSPLAATMYSPLRRALVRVPFLRLRALRALLRKCGGQSSLCQLWKSGTGWLADVPSIEEQIHPLAILESGPGNMECARRLVFGLHSANSGSEQTVQEISVCDAALAVVAEVWDTGDQSLAAEGPCLGQNLAEVDFLKNHFWIIRLPSLAELLPTELAMAYVGIVSVLESSKAPQRSWLHDLLNLQSFRFDASFLVTMDEDEDAAQVAALRAIPGTTIWRCPNGHPYGIGDCGQPMEVGHCPRCNVAIGGQNHRPVDGVRRDERAADIKIPSGYVYREDLQKDCQAGVRALPALQFRIARIILHALLLARACAGRELPPFGGNPITFCADRFREDFVALRTLLAGYDIRSDGDVRDIILVIASRLGNHATGASPIARTPDARTQQENALRRDVFDPIFTREENVSSGALQESIRQLRRSRADAGGLSAGLRQVLGVGDFTASKSVFELPSELTELPWWDDGLDFEPRLSSENLTWDLVSKQIALRSVPTGHRPGSSNTSDDLDAQSGEIMEENTAIPFPVLRMICDDMSGRHSSGPRADAVDHLFSILQWRSAAVSRFSGRLIEDRRDLTVRAVLRRDRGLCDPWKAFRSSWTALAGGELSHVQAQCREIATDDFPIVTDDLSVVDTIGTPAEGNDIGLPEVIFIATRTLAESYNKFLRLGNAILEPEAVYGDDDAFTNGVKCEVDGPLPRIRWSQAAERRDLLFEKLDDAWLANPFRRVLFYDDIENQFDLEAMERSCCSSLFQGRALIEEEAKSDHGEEFVLLQIQKQLSVGDRIAIEELCGASFSKWDQLFAFSLAVDGWAQTAASNPPEIDLLRFSISKALQSSPGLRNSVHAAIRPWAESSTGGERASPMTWPPVAALGVLFVGALRDFAEEQRAKFRIAPEEDASLDIEQLELPNSELVLGFSRTLSNAERQEVKRVLNFVIRGEESSRFLVAGSMSLTDAMGYATCEFDEGLRDRIIQLGEDPSDQISACHIDAFRRALLGKVAEHPTTPWVSSGSSVQSTQLERLQHKRDLEATLPHLNSQQVQTCRRCGGFMEFRGGCMHVDCGKCGAKWYVCCLRAYHESQSEPNDIEHLRDPTCDHVRDKLRQEEPNDR